MKKYLLPAALLSLSALSMPIYQRMQFDENKFLSGWPAAAAQSVKLDTETQYQGHGSLKIEKRDIDVTAYSGMPFSSAPGELCIKFHAKAEQSCILSIGINFNLKNGGNGSNGSYKTKIELSDKWEEHSIRITLPEKTAIIQYTFQMTGKPMDAWINDLRFEYAPDTVNIPVADSVDFDSDLNSAAWNPDSPLAGFFKMNEPANSPIEVHAAADSTGLYIGFINNYAPMPSKHEANEKDASLWEDECNEIFVCDYTTRREWQFIVNPNGALYDARLFQQQDGDPWKNDPTWESTGVKISTQKGDDFWTSKIFIPWENFGITLSDKIQLGLNLCCENKNMAENCKWNCTTSSFNEQSSFAKVSMVDGKLKIVRTRKANETKYTITRKQPLFTELLEKGTPGNYFISSWAHGSAFSDWPKNIAENVGEAKYNAWQKTLMEAWGKAGMTGPTFPWAPINVNGGKEYLFQLNNDFGMKYPFAIHNSSLDRISREKGAVYTYPESSVKVSPVDPVLNQVLLDYVNNLPNDPNYDLFKQTTAFIMGMDEPFNGYIQTFSKTMNPTKAEALDELDKEIKEKFGFGKYGLYDNYEQNETDIAFKRIALIRWFNSIFLERSKNWQKAVSKVFPGIPYKMATNNTCSGLGQLDYSLFDKDAEILACDPYPTSAAANYGFSRALYHTGFSTRILSDLTPHVKHLIMPQGFIYYGGRPITSDLCEWASQALKNGADGLMWYCRYAHYEIFDCYKSMIAINEVIGKMDKLVLPKETKTAILFSNYDSAALDDNVSHGAYSIYAILGEQLKSNFRFISTTGINNGVADLSKYKLIYIPRLTWTDQVVTAKLLEFVKNGGRIVTFDPRFMSWNIDGTEVPERKLFTAVESIQPIKGAKEINVLGKECTITPNNVLILPTGMDTETYALQGAKGAVVAKYQNGETAAVENTIGEGSVIYFGANPFGNSNLALEPGKWLDFFKENAEKIDEKMNLLIWDFTIPESSLKEVSLEPLK